MNVELPDGTVINDVPDGISKADLIAKLSANGYDTSKLGGTPPSPAQSTAPAAPNYIQQAKTAPVVGPVGMGEAAINTLSGLGSSAIGGLRGLATLATGGSLDDAVSKIKSTQESGTYQPRTAEGKHATSVVAKIFNLPQDIAEAGISAVPSLVSDRMYQSRGIRPPSQAERLQQQNVADLVGAVGPTVAATLAGLRAPVKSIAATQYEGVGLPALKSAAEQGAPAAAIREQAAQEAAQAASNKDWQNAARIDTVKEAQTLPHPPSLNPAMANPTVGNRVAAAMTGGTAIDVAMSKANKNVWGNNAKADMGLHVDVPLTSDAPFKAVRAKAAKPYEEVSKIGQLTPDSEVLSQLQSVQVPDLISDPNAAPKVQGLVDRAVDKITNGMTGAEALEQIKQLRADADSINSAKAKGTKVDPADTAKASASLQIANTLESLIEKNIPKNNPQLLSDFRKARTDIAKSYAYQNATNLDTGYLDPSKLPDNMTGVGATMRKVAANFPNAANVDPTLLSKTRGFLVRTGPAAALGFSIGGIPGSLVGAGLGEIGGLLNAKRMAKRPFQEANVIPPDRRIPLNGMLTGENQ
jgi:hypothetical protein